MERIDHTTWGRRFRPQDKAALLMVLAITLAVVVILSLLLF